MVKSIQNRWIRSERDEKAVRTGCYFDEKDAVRVREFFEELLQHSKGQFAGKPFKLLDWQYDDVIAPIFGWKRENGTRRYRKAYVEIPKKNGKSTLAAGIALYLTVGDREKGSHVFSAAATRDQASLVYEEGANMVEASAELSKVLTVRRSQKRIIYNETFSVYRAIAADAGSAQGLQAHGIVMDELHAWKNREFYESLMYAGRARSQPLIFIITTAGDDLTSICYEEHEYATRVLAGDIDATNYFAYICAATREDDWKDPKVWSKANPSMGFTIQEESLRQDLQEAIHSPARENAFKRYSLNQWVGSSEAWISADVWKHPNVMKPITEERLYGSKAYAGIDLSRTRDLSAVVWLVPKGDFLYVVPRIYMPSGVIRERERHDKVQYQAWVDQGLIIATKGNSIDYAQIRQDVNRDAKLFKPVEIGYDPANASPLCDQYMELEDGLPMVEVPQTMPQMGPASTEFESLLKQHRIIHGGNPVLTWMIEGCVAQEDLNKNMRPVKRHSRSRIDAIIALIIALGRYMSHEANRRSVYSSRGLVSV